VKATDILLGIQILGFLMFWLAGKLAVTVYFFLFKPKQVFENSYRATRDLKNYKMPQLGISVTLSTFLTLYKQSEDQKICNLPKIMYVTG